MLTVCCVLRDGGFYRAEHVERLHRGVELHLSLPHRFVCLSNTEVSCDRINLCHPWHGFFAKIELYRPGLFAGPVFYVDLDSVVVGDLDGLVVGHRFTTLHSFWNRAYGVSSAVMAWDTTAIDLSCIYRSFCRAPTEIMKAYRLMPHLGDQGFVQDFAPETPEYWQDKHPGRVCGYRHHCAGERVPQGCSIVTFGGAFRPWSTPLGRRIWREQETEWQLR